MNKYYNNNTIETNGIRSVAGGGTGNQYGKFSGSLIITPSIYSEYYGNKSSLTQTVTSISPSVSAVCLSFTSASIFNVTLNSNTAFIFGFLPYNTPYFVFRLIITGDGIVRTIFFPPSVKWHNGTGYTTSGGTLNKFNAYTFTTSDNGTSWLGIRDGTNFG